MVTTLLIILILLTITSVFLLAALLYRTVNTPLHDLMIRLNLLDKNLECIERQFREDMAVNRVEVGRALHDFNESLPSRIAENTASSIQKLDKIDDSVDMHLKTLREDNSQKLEQIKAVVDEKLYDTLERRLGESFKLVGERLEMVQKGLGEMHALASGVGDLKKDLSNPYGFQSMQNFLRKITSDCWTLKSREVPVW